MRRNLTFIRKVCKEWSPCKDTPWSSGPRQGQGASCKLLQAAGSNRLNRPSFPREGLGDVRRCSEYIGVLSCWSKCKCRMRPGPGARIQWPSRLDGFAAGSRGTSMYELFITFCIAFCMFEIVFLSIFKLYISIKSATPYTSKPASNLWGLRSTRPKQYGSLSHPGLQANSCGAQLSEDCLSQRRVEIPLFM